MIIIIFFFDFPHLIENQLKPHNLKVQEIIRTKS